VIVIAENMLIKTPMPRVIANPCTILVPNQAKITQVMRLETLESLIDGQAR